MHGAPLYNGLATGQRAVFDWTMQPQVCVNIRSSVNRQVRQLSVVVIYILAQGRDDQVILVLVQTPKGWQIAALDIDYPPEFLQKDCQRVQFVLLRTCFCQFLANTRGWRQGCHRHRVSRWLPLKCVLRTYATAWCLSTDYPWRDIATWDRPLIYVQFKRPANQRPL